MTNEEIIRMALKSGFYNGEIGRAEDAFQRFANLVAAAEREECAKLLDVNIINDAYSTALLNSYADAIRARGNT